MWIPVWKIAKIVTWGSQEWIKCTFLGLKHKNALFGWVHPPSCTLNLVYISVGVFRYQKIFKQNWFYFDLFKFNWIFTYLGGSPLGGWVGVNVSVWGCPMHMHTHTCIHIKHDNFMQMATLNGNPYDVIHIHVCACMYVHLHACVGHPHIPTHTPTSPHPTQPKGWPSKSVEMW